jgi:4-amino-4-deoxy-L-arabinose transferase-like glycosyltransferase
MPNRTTTLFAITLLLLLAAAMRIPGAGEQPLWTDEGHSLFIAENPVERLQDNHHPPLYFAALNAWSRLVGDSRVALRFLSIGASLLALAVTYRLGRDWFGTFAALAAVALLAVSDLNIEYSRQIRHYAWLVLGTTLSSLTFLGYLRTHRRSQLIPYILSLAFLFYSHYLGFMVAPIQGLFGLVLWRGSWPNKRRLIVAWAATAILYLPWVVAIRHLLVLAQEGGLASRPGALASTADALRPVLNLLSDGQVALVFGFALLGAWGIVRYARLDLKSLARLYLLASGLGLLLIMLVMNNWLTVLTPRTLVFVTPALFLLVGYGLSLLPTRPRELLVALGVVVGVGNTTVVQPRYNNDDAAALLAAHDAPGDLVILETGFDDNAFAYEIEEAVDDPQMELIRTLIWTTDRYEIKPVIPEIEDDLEAHDRVWVVQWLHAPQVMPYLDSPESDFERVASYTVPIGEPYATEFPDPYIDLVLYEKQ